MRPSSAARGDEGASAARDLTRRFADWFGGPDGSRGVKEGNP